MRSATLDRFLAPWVFVLTGILFNILSAVITHYFIGINNEQISAIDRKMMDRQILIDSQWQSRIEVERKKEFFILLLSSGSEPSAAALNYYRSYLDELAQTHHLDRTAKNLAAAGPADIERLLTLSEAAQQAIIELINETYFETLEFQDARMPLERDNARLFSIAIFLQVVGLILVLARDLRRN